MTHFICPVCRAPLARETKTWSCTKGHGFDVAREGYVNLLLAQQRSSREPGDNAEMIRARADFLQAGHYAPLRAAVTDALRPLQSQDLLDLGCGEGYYTDAMRGVAAAVTGLDISKPAIQRAAKRYPGITWLVASGARLPVADDSLDTVCCLFTPLHVAEMRRVLRTHGHVLVVTPAADHLWTLREKLFDQIQPHEPEKFIEVFGAGFELRNQQEVRFPLQLDAASLQPLLTMTPYAWRAKPEKRAALEQAAGLDTAAAFTLLLLRKT